MNNKKVLMVVASKGFRDEELFVPAEILEDAGFKITIASDKEGKAQGDDGGEVDVDFTLEEIEPQNHAAIAFIGGPGALDHLDNAVSYKKAKEFYQEGKIVAAICIAPVILAKAGLLEDKKATVWTAPLDKTGKKTIEKHGGSFQDSKLVKDEGIITANGPQAAKEFGQTLVKSL